MLTWQKLAKRLKVLAATGRIRRSIRSVLRGTRTERSSLVAITNQQTFKILGDDGQWYIEIAPDGKCTLNPHIGLDKPTAQFMETMCSVLGQKLREAWNNLENQQEAIQILEHAIEERNQTITRQYEENHRLRSLPVPGEECIIDDRWQGIMNEGKT